MKDALIIFIRNPELGKVKSRLAKTIGQEKALAIYKQLLNKTRVETLKVNAARYLFYDRLIDEGDAWESKDFEKRLQLDVANLGERISAAVKEVFAKGHQKVMIIGSDCYDLTSTLMETAFDHLQEADVILGPANDGGYYLLATKAFQPELFEGIDWSTEKVLEQSLAKAEKLALSSRCLATLIDIDTEEDLKKSGFPKALIESLGNSTNFTPQNS